MLPAFYMLSLLTMASLHPFASLGHRNFRLFWTGQFIALTGAWMYQTAQNWLVYQLTDSAFFLGLAGTAASLPILLFTLAGGVIADRFPKHSTILATRIIAMLISLVLAFLAATDRVIIWHVLVLTFLIGSCNAVEIPARQSFIIELVGKKNLLNGIAMISSAFHGASMIGPAVAGVIIKTFGIGACFFLSSLSFLGIIIAIFMMRFPADDGRSSPDRDGVIREFREGISYIFGHPRIYVLLISVGIISFFGFPYMSFLPVYARDILKTGETGLGILMGSSGAGALTGATGLALRGDISRKGILMAAAGITLSIALLLFSLSEIPLVSYVMLFFVGAGATNMIATANSLLQLNVPDHLRGRVMSSFTTMFLGMAPLGNFVVGSLAYYTGTQRALTTAAVLCLIGITFLLIKRPEIVRM